VQDYLAESKPGGRFALTDLVRTGLRDGRMQIDVKLPDELARLSDAESAANRPVRLDVAGSDLAWSLKSYGEKGDRRTIALACYDAEALAPFQCLALHVGPGMVKVYGAAFPGEGGGGGGQLAKLEITQTEEGIRYSWWVPGRQESTELEQTGRVARLSELRQTHPAFVQEVLSPALRRLGVRAFLRRHPVAEVYGVFPAIRPDDRVARQVDDLLPRMAAARASQREAASAELDALGRPAILAVLRLDRGRLSPEQNTRLETFLDRMGERGPPTWAVTPRDPLRDVEFLLDCLDDDDPAVRAAAKAALEAALGRRVDFDPALTGDARAAAVGRLCDQFLVPPGEGNGAKPPGPTTQVPNAPPKSM
jgi:hypothetical protein